MNLTHSFFTECRYTEAFVVNVRIALDELIWTSMIQHGCFFLLLVSVNYVNYYDMLIKLRMAVWGSDVLFRLHYLLF